MHKHSRNKCIWVRNSTEQCLWASSSCCPVALPYSAGSRGLGCTDSFWVRFTHADCSHHNDLCYTRPSNLSSSSFPHCLFLLYPNKQIPCPSSGSWSSKGGGKINKSPASQCPPDTCWEKWRLWFDTFTFVVFQSFHSHWGNDGNCTAVSLVDSWAFSKCHVGASALHSWVCWYGLCTVGSDVSVPVGAGFKVGTSYFQTNALETAG